MVKYTLKCEGASGDQRPQVVLAGFPNGIPSESFFEEKGDDQLEFTIYGNTESRKAKQRLLVAENDLIEFVGKNFGTDQLQSKLCKYAVGVVDKGTKTIRLYDAPAFALKQRVKRVRYNEEEPEVDATDGRTAYEKSLAAKTTLVESFGARRNLQAIQAAQRNRVDAEALSAVSKAITSRLDAHAANAPTLEDTQEEMDADRAIPPYDLSATEPADVYKFEDLITPEEYQAIKQPSKLLAKASRADIANWSAKGPYGEYILSKLSAGLPSNANARNKAACILLYISYLMQLLKSERRLNTEDHGLRDVPLVVRKRLLEVFTSKAEGDDDKIEYKLTEKLKDKIVAYIFVLALHLEGFSFDYELVTKDLRLNTTKAKNILRGLGLKLDGKGKTARLVAPLDFPKINLRKKAR